VLESRVVIPEQAYREVRGVAPDLLVFFGDLSHRSLSSVGTAGIFASIDDVERDRGRGGCNHDWDGVFALSGPSVTARGRIEGASILDIAPTCLGVLDVSVPSEMRGRDLRGLSLSSS
jgi:predicted AlkP superfamily phosphohydrolase/phosphomutase